MQLSEYSTDSRTKSFFTSLENRLNIIHNHKYDYSNTIYKTKRYNITYICPVHGEVTQNAGEHIRGHGCKACSKISNGMKLHNKTKDNLIKQFIKTHGTRYDYSKVNYKGTDSKVTIICKIHGEFTQNAVKHKKGSGCPTCANLIRTRTSEEFIQEFYSKTNKKYEYIDLQPFLKLKDVIKFICPIHGIQEQTVTGHLRGTGCPHCNMKELRWSRKFFENQKTTLYYIKINNLYKIGLTKRNIEKRFETETLIRRNVTIISLWEFKNGGIAYDLEVECLKATKEFAIKTELLKKGGNSEIRKVDVLSIIKPIIENAFQ